MGVRGGSFSRAGAVAFPCTARAAGRFSGRRRFLKESLALVVNNYEKCLTFLIIINKYEYPPLIRLERGTSKTIWNTTFQNAGFARQAALRCQAACDPGKSLLLGAGE